jgi:hypothetical protein
VKLGYTFFTGSLALLGEIAMLGMGFLVLHDEWSTLGLYHRVLFVGMTTFAVLTTPYLLYVILLRKPLVILTRKGLVDRRLFAGLRGLGFVRWSDVSYVSRLPFRTRHGFSFVRVHLRDGGKVTLMPEGYGLSSRELVRLLHGRLVTARAMRYLPLVLSPGASSEQA